MDDGYNIMYMKQSSCLFKDPQTPFIYVNCRHHAWNPTSSHPHSLKAALKYDLT